MNSTRICIVSPIPPPFGGMAVQAEKLSHCLKKEGYDVYSVPTNITLTGVLKPLGSIPFVRTFVRQTVFLIRLNKAIKTADTIYFLTGFFNFFFWVTYPALILMLLQKRKIVLSARGGGARAFFRKYKTWVKPVFNRLNAITVPSGFLKDAFEQELEIKTIVVPNIADLSQFAFTRRDRLEPKLIVTRSLEDIYDIPSVILAFNEVKKLFPSALLGIVGDGSRRSALESLVCELDLKNCVRFYGELSHEKIAAVYQQYDIFINASKVDNLPGSILEAFASGLPVVSTNAGGIPYMVRDGENGLLCETGDHTSLAKNAIKILNTPEYGQALAIKGYVELQRYTWPHIKEILIPILNNSTNE